MGGVCGCEFELVDKHFVDALKYLILSIAIGLHGIPQQIGVLQDHSLEANENWQIRRNIFFDGGKQGLLVLLQ